MRLLFNPTTAYYLILLKGIHSQKGVKCILILYLTTVKFKGFSVHTRAEISIYLKRLTGRYVITTVQ